MNNLNFVFSEIDTEQSFNQLGNSLGTKSISKCIQIPPEKGSGTIKKIDFEKGLHIRSWDLTLNTSFVFNKKSQPGSGAGNAFSIVYILSPEAVVLESQVLHKEVLLQGSITVLLLSNSFDLNLRVLAGHRVKAIDISITAEWVMNQFDQNDSVVNSFMSKLKTNNNPFLFIEKGSATEYKTALDIHASILDGTKTSFYLKAKTLSLVSDFFSKTFSSIADPFMESSTAVHQEKLLMVEKILEQHFEKNLPSIESIAHNAALSESTLKRHFKVMFGKSIYEYYLEKKMDYAKRLLLEKPLTVKEVAYRLGYEKTSNFIHIFKKFHSYSPGYLKKNISF